MPFHPIFCARLLDNNDLHWFFRVPGNNWEFVRKPCESLGNNDWKFRCMFVHSPYFVYSASYTLNTFLAQALYDSDASLALSLLLSLKQNIAYVRATFFVTNFALGWSQVTARSGTYRVSPTVACTWNYGTDCAASTTILIRWSVLCLTKLRIMFATR